MKRLNLRTMLNALALTILSVLAPAASAQPILWATASADAGHPNGRLLRIDYTSGAIQATYNGPSGITIGDGFTGVAVRPSNGQVFVTDGFGTNVVFRIDPNTGDVLSSFPSPTGSASIDGLEFFGNELYARAVDQSTIYRINPDSGALLGNLPNVFPGTVGGGLTIVDGFLYSNGTGGNMTIARRDLLTGALINQFPSPNNEVVLGMATDGISLFAASGAGFVYRLDPLNGTVLDSRNIGIALDGLGGPIPVPEPSAAPLILAFAVISFVGRRAAKSGLESMSAPELRQGAQN